MAGNDHGGRARASLALFAILTLLQLVPVWSVRYLPTTDGPSHLYNAWVLRELASGDGGAIAQTFRVDWRPHPNWIETAFLAEAMGVVPPLVAEKLLVSLIVVLFAWGLWSFSASPPAAAFGLLFTFHWLLQMGFYNHSVGVGLFLIATAFFWRRREQPPAKTAMVLGAMLVVCYFASPMMLLLTMGAIALLWLFTVRDWRHLLAFLPVLPLLGWYLAVASHDPIQGGWPPLRKLLAYLLRGRICYTFSVRQTAAGMVLLIIVLLCVVPAIRAREVFLLLTVAMVVLYFVAPDTFGGGLFLRQRLALLVFLTALAWIRLPQRMWVTVPIALAVVANTLYLTRQFREASAIVESAVRSCDVLEPGHTVLMIVQGKVPSCGNFPLLWHAVDYAAIDRQLIDAGDYEPGTHHFTIAFRDPLAKRIEPDAEPVEAWASRVDYILLANAGNGSIDAITRYYQPLRDTDLGRSNLAQDGLHLILLRRRG